MDLDVEGLRAEYLKAVDRYEQAAAEMRAAIDDVDGNLDVMRAHIAAGRRLRDVLPSIAPADSRSKLSDAADELERARHAGQRLAYQILVAEGLTLAEVGRTFGVSRSLVSRMIHEDS